jgi:hypothetical protein
MQIPNATGLHRKSGGEQWRDLRFIGPFLGMFFDRGIMGLERRGSVVEVTQFFPRAFADTLAAPPPKPFASQDSL